jgi:CPA1 family monovalent cation:H+ antiporter
MAIIEINLALLLAVAVIAALGRWVPIPLPLLLIGGGIALSFVPGFGSVHIAPEIFFLLFIPPLLFADGWMMPKRDLLGVLRPVLLLAFGLVFATVVVVGYAIHFLIPSLPLAAAFALGAIVSPTDAVATAAMTERLPLPSRITLILNGESLINDASGLVAFKFAAAAVATGAFSLSSAAFELLLVACGGVIVGVVAGWAVGALRVGLKRVCVDDPTIQTILSLLTPYAAYIAAEQLHLSGILAVVSAGLYAGWHDARNISIATRQRAWEVWEMLLFVFNGLVFLLLGLTLLPAISALARTQPWPVLALYALLLWLIVTLIRVVWVYPGTYLPPLFSRKIREQEPVRNPRGVFIVGWAGLRGSVTMAAALSIPVATDAGAAFPGRDMIIFLSATTILLTLLINGLTLPTLIRAFGLRGDGNAEREQRAAAIAMAQAAAAALAAELPKLKRADERSFAQRLVAEYEARVARFTANADRRRELDSVDTAQRNLTLLGINAERDELSTLRDQGVINEETVRALEPRIDHAELVATEATRSPHG